MNYLRAERLDRLAREYALGTLSGGARRRFERVLRASPAANLAVSVWQQRLSVLESEGVARPPPEANWRSLEQRLFPRRSPPAADGPMSWLGRLFSARVFGGALAGVLLCALVLRFEPEWIGMEPRTDALPPSYVGLLLDAAGKPSLLASSRRHGRQLTVKLLQPLVIPAGQVAQLWALPRDGGAPFPVGSVPPTGSARIALGESSEKLFFGVAQLAVSIEPAPAAAGARPSGAFVLVGHCVKLW